ncbi:MAG: LuxR C-terminal-related transcriptional regulator [Bacteroidia bacterium]
MITLMKMNLSTKEIATILNITPESVNKARYRLRKKLNLDTDQNLQQFILAL